MLGLKMGVENDIFRSEVGSGFGEPGSTPPPRIPRSTPLLVSIDLVHELVAVVKTSGTVFFSLYLPI